MFALPAIYSPSIVLRWGTKNKQLDKCCYIATCAVHTHGWLKHFGAFLGANSCCCFFFSCPEMRRVMHIMLLASLATISSAEIAAKISNADHEVRVSISPTGGLSEMYLTRGSDGEEQALGRGPPRNLSGWQEPSIRPCSTPGLRCSPGVFMVTPIV